MAELGREFGGRLEARGHQDSEATVLLVTEGLAPIRQSPNTENCTGRQSNETQSLRSQNGIKGEEGALLQLPEGLP